MIPVRETLINYEKWAKKYEPKDGELLSPEQLVDRFLDETCQHINTYYNRITGCKSCNDCGKILFVIQPPDGTKIN